MVAAGEVMLRAFVAPVGADFALVDESGGVGAEECVTVSTI